MADGNSQTRKSVPGRDETHKRMPELYQVVIECRDEAEQREVFERMKGEGRKVRLHVL
ncbi:MAG: hypothetical protein JF612_04555 [Planctomycetia bacterium]|jgi:hypothetical protein|nr:hypothetical protein [Planctomycetia bacterium]